VERANNVATIVRYELPHLLIAYWTRPSSLWSEK